MAGLAKKLLLVDDDPAFVATLSEQLRQSEGFAVTTAATGKEALEKIRGDYCDVVILDIGLPDQNGYDVARVIRRYLEPCPTLVALTGYGQEEDKQRSREAGFDHHLVKPVSINDLEKILA